MGALCYVRLPVPARPRLLVLATLMCALACHRARVTPQVSAIPPGTILLLPPRDVVQEGRPHEAGAGSGAIVLDYMRTAFVAKGWEPMTTSNTAFSYTSVASEEAALAEARVLHARYVVQVVLGEFRDAAPMTFRPDFVTLQEARLWDAQTGKKLWAAGVPFVWSYNNLRHYQHLLRQPAQMVVDNIVATREGATAWEAPRARPAEPAAPAPAAATGPAEKDAERRLSELKLLRDRGLITKEEYERKRAEVVDGL